MHSVARAALCVLAVARCAGAVSLHHGRLQPAPSQLMKPVIEGKGPDLGLAEAAAQVFSSAKAKYFVSNEQAASGGELSLSKIKDVLENEPEAAKSKSMASGDLAVNCPDCGAAVEEGTHGGEAAGEGGALGEANANADLAVGNGNNEEANEEAGNFNNANTNAEGGNDFGKGWERADLQKLLEEVRNGGKGEQATPEEAARLEHQVKTLQSLITHAKEINKIIPEKRAKLKQLIETLHSKTAGVRAQLAHKKLAKQESLLMLVDQQTRKLQTRLDELKMVRDKLLAAIEQSKREINGTNQEEEEEVPSAAGSAEGGSAEAGSEEPGGKGAVPGSGSGSGSGSAGSAAEGPSASAAAF